MSRKFPFPDSTNRKQSLSSVKKESEEKLLCGLSKQARKHRNVPFYIPHKKVLEKMEEKVVEPEPMVGLSLLQEKRLKMKHALSPKLEPLSMQDLSDGDKNISTRKKSSGGKQINELKRKPIVSPLEDVLQHMKEEKTLAFEYMTYAVSKESVHFTPYFLQVVPYKEVNKHNYMTISHQGVTHFTNEMVFTKLSVWEFDYKIFCNVVKIKFFKLFRYWKAFYFWRKTILFKKYNKIRKFMEKSVLSLNEVLGKCLLHLKRKSFLMSFESFADLTINMDTPLFYLIERQMERLEIITKKLENFRLFVLKVASHSCQRMLFICGFIFVNGKFEHTIPHVDDENGKMSFTEKAKIRKLCEQLTRFLNLLDYLTIDMLHFLLKKSYGDMAKMIKIHLDATPSESLLNNSDLNGILETVPRPSLICTWPLIQVEVDITETLDVVLSPPESLTLEMIYKIEELWNSTIEGFKPFIKNECFLYFTEALFSGKQSQRILNEEPVLCFILKLDKDLLDDIKFLPDTTRLAYDIVKTYLRRFDNIFKMYAEDIAMEANTLINERDVYVLKTLCSRYRSEIRINSSISSYQTLGIIFLCLIPIRILLTDLPSQLINILGSATPVMGKEMVQKILSESDRVNNELDQDPETAAEIVEYDILLSNVESTIDDLDMKLEYLRELYDMMAEFNMYIPPQDLQDFLGLPTILATLRANAEVKLQQREKLVGKFARTIDNNISALIKNCLIILECATEPWLLEKESKIDEVLGCLDNLTESLTESLEINKQIQSWQKMFKIPYMRIEVLDEVAMELQLRQLLWKSSEEWNALEKNWYECDFTTLNIEEVQVIAVNYGKIMNKLEKGLPKNEILHDFKSKIELMKTKLPTISYLGNPNLKARHWMKIEAVLNTRFSAEVVLTLQMLEDMHIFDHSEELMEISGQASSEASLESVLQKIEDIWKVLELPVLPYRDYKDIFMLGSLEEVQTAIDECNMHVGIILSSRNCGPIKGRVEEWERILDYFQKTVNEWFICMQTWMYLEVLFTAPDIQRQLPNEARIFTIVDKTWKDIMRKTAKVPLALNAATDPDLLERFKSSNAMLDQIMKCLEAYLETKRVAFPRFYFLSNDELLEILAQTRNPHAVQPHLRKCFDAISKLEFAAKVKEYAEGEVPPPDDDEVELTTDIAAMISPENERVGLGKGLKARGNVEDWLSKVEEAMFASVRKCMKQSLSDYIARPRVDWISRHPNQVVLTVSQIMWAKSVHAILEAKPAEKIDIGLIDFEKEVISDLNDSAALTRKNISKLFRRVLCALITIDVHARDTITNMKERRVQSPYAFEWLKMIRYYWEEDIDNCVARMSSAYYIYGHEYIGAGGVLVITPLTDRCYLCLMGALQLDLGGAPSGPAGTGKTETTKDLSKSLGIQCVVFNCSEGLDYKMMGKFFSGLVSSGAWCCFDEFNRINIEVLSVIAQQLITIRNAKVAKLKRFMFEGREIKLVHTCAAFITMNPGYAGRTELPDNLKALFRPISMMVPDYGLIAEVILYSEGFESSKNLAKKMVQMYKLCSEQLSQQDHYDFGMRAVKSVLVMAGALKRASPDQHEEVTLMCALRDSNLPKFLADDAILFGGILGDLFPGVALPQKDYALMETIIEQVTLEAKLQVEKCMFVKVIQLHETMIVRWGVMLVGPTGGGKTTVLTILGETLQQLKIQGYEDPYFQIVHKYVMNPKSLTMGELYGEVNPLTLEWKDGLLAISLRVAVQCTKEDHQWIVCDGPVDAVWIENMNTVLDDNKMLCLANSERIKLTPYVHMVFEVADLAQASPATVSRCGMVYIDPSELRWQPFVRTWLAALPENSVTTSATKDYIYQLFQNIDPAFHFIKKYCSTGIPQVDISKASMLCFILQDFLKKPGDKPFNKESLPIYLCQCFLFSYIWAIGGNLLDDSRVKLEVFIKKQFLDIIDPEELPGDLWNAYIDPVTKKFESWSKIIPIFKYNENEPFFETLVPTKDTIRFGYIMERLIKTNKPVMFTGNTGVGKSVITKTVLNSLGETGYYVPFTMNFSAQTNSNRTQEIIESRLERKKLTVLGAPIGKKVIIFIDDVNMPKLDVYGSQATIELLRQFLDFGGMYDREKMFWKFMKDVVLLTACAPPGGGRNPLTARFTRHFAMLFIITPNDDTLKVIFKSILSGYLENFAPEVSAFDGKIINASVDIYGKVISKLLPTPAKSHYVFNLRDLSKCMQGVLQASVIKVREPITIIRLWFHECLRVFHDRLINNEDRRFFFQLMQEVCTTHFGIPVVEIPLDPLEKLPLILFGDFINYGAVKESRIYEEINDLTKLKDVLYSYLEEYNASARAEMKLVLFTDALEHVVRISRVLRAERGNALLVGPGGSGRRSLATLSAFINEYKCFGLELTKNYDLTSFHDDLRSLYFSTGINNDDNVFLFTDTQIIQEEFLEDVNNMLNSGEVPNLFEGEDYEKVMLACRLPAAEAGVNVSDREAVFAFFINKIRAKLHLCMCMSPVGDQFRRRCRMFPSLVNCCTIDWFVKWPSDALFTVATTILGSKEAENVEILAEVCVLMHESTEIMTERMLAEIHRYFYTTPSSYLDLLKLYTDMLDKKRQEILKSRSRIANGLTKLYETFEVVGVMEQSVKKMEPVIAQKAKETLDMLAVMKVEQAAADKVKNDVLEDETNAKIQAAATQELSDDAARDLELAMPAMEAAQNALKGLNKADINELRVFNKPPALVKFVMEPVCLLLNSKTDWDSAKKVLGDSNFLKNLEEYDKDHIKEAMLKKIKPYMDSPDFLPEIVEKTSKVCRSMCLWVRAIDTYAKVFRIVEPKIQKQQEAEVQMAAVMGFLKEKQRMLAAVEEQLAAMQASLGKMEEETAALQYDMDLAAARLVRAGKLTQALADEQTRWEETVKTLSHELECTSGDIILASGCVAYFGAFPNVYRIELSKIWIKKCLDLHINSSPKFNLITVLSDPYTVRQWNSYGLPRDAVSVENGILVTKAGRWPLMIDPQEQANRWIRNMERENQLNIVKLSDGNYMRIMENCIRLGRPVLIEDIAESLDATLSPILQKNVFLSAGRLLIHLGDNDIEYDTNFKLYITTKLSNPHYLPDICIQVTLVNFTVTLLGLEDQLLADVVRLERPDLEILRSELITRINNDKMQLKAIEDKILKMLFASQGNILDDEELIETLNDSKETSGIVVARLIDSEATEISISIAREGYRTVATRGAVLYFAVSSISDIDPMYQFSLKYFQNVFNNVIEISQKHDSLAVHLNVMLYEITYAVYANISRGLFERHKLVFSFLLNSAIFRQANIISESYWLFLLKGPIGSKVVPGKMPNIPTLSSATWLAAHHLDDAFPAFKGLAVDCLKIIEIQIGTLSVEVKIDPNTSDNATKNWNSELNDFEKLCLLKALKNEALVTAVAQYVNVNIGRAFIESSAVTLNKLYMDMNNVTPLVFILSSGSDPFGAFHKFATEMGFRDRVQSISLGQGQGPIAEKLIFAAIAKGNWVFLQNCHLAASWMLTLEQIVQKLLTDLEPPHTEFRLYLSSMPSSSFPVSVLQNSVKVTNEPPKGLRANIKRAFFDMNEDWFLSHELGQNWRSLIFGLCMFHAIIQERKKFGPLGWTIIYEFNDSDRECALLNLEMFCKNRVILWDALEYILGEITYGGRVTDVWDQRTLKTILTKFFAPCVLQPNYAYSSSGTYYCPKGEKLAEYQCFIDNLPLVEAPELFGMNENANLVFQNEEVFQFISSILKSQPVDSGGDSGAQSPDQIAAKISEDMKNRIILLIDVDTINEKHLEKDSEGRLSSLTTVLVQEVNRFNKLLGFIHTSLNDLQKAIKGFIVMSDDLESVYQAFLNNRVPQIWSSKSYNSLKSLGSWVFDLILRIDFVMRWLETEAPPSSWISGLFFPQGLLTGTLQSFARRYGISINVLMFDFTPIPLYLFQEDIKSLYDTFKDSRAAKNMYQNLSKPPDGIYIHGLFIDAGRWDIENMQLVDPNPGERNAPLPVFWLRPVQSLPVPDTRYISPLYKTGARAGVLSTTGHSTNFVLPFFLPTSRTQAYWILQGTALLTQITD